METYYYQKLPEMQTVENEFKKPFKDFFGLPLRCSQSSISIIGEPVNTKIWVSKQNKDFIKTQYFFTESKKILHFTSLKALFSILNEKTLRLYNLTNSDDKEEYRYFAENIRPFYRTQNIPNDFFNSRLQMVKDNALCGLIGQSIF